jgi:hypothetical protein
MTMLVPDHLEVLKRATVRILPVSVDATSGVDLVGVRAVVARA